MDPILTTESSFSAPPLSGPVSDDAFNHDTLDAQSQLSAGVELIVRGLNRSAPGSSIRQLEELLRNLNAGQDPTNLQVFPPIRDSAAFASTKPLDYAIIGFKAELKRKPRPELMETVRSKLIQVSEGKLDVDWNIAPGHDKARIVSFRDETKMGVARLKDELEKCLKSKRMEFQGCTMTGEMVRFHLIRKEDVRELKNHPPVVGGNECTLRTPKFIQPNYAMEMGIVGIDIFDDPEFFIGGYIERTYRSLAKLGHAVCQQRLELNDTVYCVVVENREIAEKLLEDPFPIFDACTHRPSRPQYLYRLNQQGYPTSWQRSSSSRDASDQRLDKKRWDGFEDKTNQCAQAIDTLAKQMTLMDERQRRQEYQNQCAFRAMLEMVRLINEKAQAQHELRSLKREQLKARRLLTFAQSPNSPLKEIEYRKQEVRDLAREIEELEKEVKDANNRTLAFQAVAFPTLLPASTFIAEMEGHHSDGPMDSRTDPENQDSILIANQISRLHFSR